jgi:hypothetical protein
VTSKMKQVGQQLQTAVDGLGRHALDAWPGDKHHLHNTLGPAVTAGVTSGEGAPVASSQRVGNSSCCCRTSLSSMSLNHVVLFMS